jgi:hypothetical protein
MAGILQEFRKELRKYTLMVSIPLLIFTASVCIAIFKPSGGRLIFILISIGINPIANQFGIFSSARISMVGNIFMHLIYPIVLNPKALRTLLSRTGLLVLAIIFSSTLQLAFSVDSISYTAGFKTILLMLGSWLWAQSLSIEIIRNYGYLTNRFLIKELFIVSILVLIVSLFFRNLYFSDGRYQASGGFTSPAILSALIIILILMCSEIRTYLRIAVIAFEIAILITTGSRGVLIALLITIALISISNALKAKKIGEPLALRLIPNIFVLFSVVGFFFIDYLTRYRSFEFLDLLNSDSEARIGTLGFRQNLFARMIGEYENFTLNEKLIGLGAGSGTSLAMNYISSLRDSNYTSGRVFHNGFLQLLIEAGLIGVILFLILTLTVFHYRKITYISGFGYIWTVFYLIALFFTSNPFATSALLAGLIYTVFLVPTYRIKPKDDH